MPYAERNDEGIVVALYAAGWQRRLAERASRRRLGSVSALRWTIASQYQLPLGTFLGVAALLVVRRSVSGHRLAIAALIMGGATTVYWLLNLVVGLNAE